MELDHLASSLIAILLSLSHHANTTRERKSGASDGSETAASRATPLADERSGGAGDCPCLFDHLSVCSA